MANKAELIKRCEELGIDTKPLTTNALLEDAIKAKEAELAAQADTEQKPSKDETEKDESGSGTEDNGTESSDSVKETEDTVIETPEDESEEESSEEESEEDESEEEISEEESEEEDPLVYTDKRGRKWRFKENAPKTMNFEGHPLSQEEILQDEEIISELVYGNNTFLIQID